MTENHITLSVVLNRWRLNEPFSVAGYTWNEVPVVTVEISDGTYVGRGEGAPIFYKNEDATELYTLLKNLIDRTNTLETLEQNLPLLDLPSGAKNALDCALWDLRIKRGDRDLAKQLGIGEYKPLTTVVTVVLGDRESMAQQAARYQDRPILKVKLGSETGDDERILAVRDAAPKATLIIDANCGWSIEQLNSLIPALAAAGVEMVEQPLPAEQDSLLKDYRGVIPLCADESCQSIADLPKLEGLYDMVNIKLDKTAGLTGAIALAEQAAERGFGLMVGNMLGSSLAMAPAHAIGQLCRYIDLDGPLYISSDRTHPLRYEGSTVYPPTSQLWG